MTATQFANEQRSREPADLHAIYGNLPLLDDHFLELIKPGTRKTSQLTVAEREEIVNFAEVEALRLVVNKVISDGLVFPIDVTSIAHNLGVEVYSTDIEQTTPEGSPVDGIIWKQRGEQCARIRVARGGSPEHTAFTICHELGHFVTWKREVATELWLNFEKYDIRSASEGDAEPEQFLANSFAHKLLMPDYALASKLQEGLPIPDLARFFGVSTMSAQRRMTYLDLATQDYPPTIHPADC